MKIVSQIKTVLWAFLGVRSKVGRERDVKDVTNPIVFLCIALVLFLIFVGGLILVVNLVVK